MFGDEVSSLIYDLGSFYCRVGYSGEDIPKCVIQPYIGINKSSEKENYFYGENDLRFFKENTIVNNIVGSNGFIENFDLFEKMTDYIFDEALNIDPKELPILFSEPSIHNKDIRMKLTESMFEKYGLPAMFICKSAVLSAFSLGRSSCLVLDSGHFSTYSTPVHDGYASQKSLIKFDIGGHYVTNELLKIIENKGFNVVPHYKISKNIIDSQVFVEYLKNVKDGPSYEYYSKREILRDMKENILTLSDEVRENKIPASYELPDGKTVEICEERYSILERFFHPIKEIPGFMGIHQMVIDSINKADIEIKKELYSNIVITGGNTLFNMFPERIQKQIHNTCQPNIKIKINTPQSISERKFSSWIGGSILASVGNFHQLWLSKQEYDEHGSILIERKCPCSV